MEKINFESLPSTDTPISAHNLNQVQTNVENAIKDVENVELLAVSSVAPSECSEGDKYFNTDTKLIYEATTTNTWSSNGTTPIPDIFYIVLSEQKIYTYNGTTLVSVGGGASEGGGETLPVGSEIDFDGETTDIPDGWEQVDDPNTYSTTEVKTNKIYIDKNNNEYPVYRRVLRGNTGTSTNWVNLGNIPNLLRIVDIRGIISSSGIDYPLNLNISSTYSVNLRNNNGVIQFNHGNEVNNRDIEVTIEYTKTTD